MKDLDMRKDIIKPSNFNKNKHGQMTKQTIDLIRIKAQDLHIEDVVRKDLGHLHIMRCLKL